MENEARRALSPEALKENLLEQSSKATLEADIVLGHMRVMERGASPLSDVQLCWSPASLPPVFLPGPQALSLSNPGISPIPGQVRFATLGDSFSLFGPFTVSSSTFEGGLSGAAIPLPLPSGSALR